MSKNHAKKVKKSAKTAKKPMKNASPTKHTVKTVSKAVARQPAGKAPKDIKDAEGSSRTRVRREAVAHRHSPEEVSRAIETLAQNEAVIAYLKKNVSKRATDVVNALGAPKTDEALALELDMKINAVRRILNILQGYGVTNYYIAKNVNGWLSFAWYINVGKLPPFFEYVKTLESKKQTVSNDCNDYFICGDCYDKSKLIFTFDAAFEEGFKCSSCGNSLKMVDRDQAASLMNTAFAESKVAADARADVE